MSDRARVRAATADDLPALERVYLANGETAAWPDRPGLPYLEHLLVRGRVPLAEIGGEVAGFAGAIDLGEGRFLADLFVVPERHGQGVGRALLEAAFEGHAGPRLTFSSADPNALPLYVRAGLRPWWPNLYLWAPGGTAGLRDTPELTVEAAGVAETAAHAAALAGHDRSADFGYYAALPDAAGFVVREGDAVAAVGWSGRTRNGTGRWLQHATIAGGADPVGPVVAAFRFAAGANGPVGGCVPGPHPALPILLEAGFRITDRDTLCTSDPGWLDPERILPNPGFL